MAEEYELYLIERISNDRSFEEGALYAGKEALIYDSVKEEGNIYTVLKNSNKKYVDNFEIIKGELFYFSQNEQEKKWAQEIGIKVSPYIVINGELMSADKNLDLMDEATGSIIIPQNVTKIGNGAFRDVEGLRSIVIPGTVKEIGEHAFSGNPTLESVVMEEGVEKIGAFAFQSCTALQTVKIAESVASIGESCFRACTSLVEINIPKLVKEIAYRVLESTKMREIILPEGVETISARALANCSELTNVTIPSTVKSISGDVLAGTNKLTNLEISPNNENYSFSDSFLMSRDGKNLYLVLPNLAEINIPETVETIQSGVFASYEKHAVMNISKNVKNIQSAFSRMIVEINVDEDNPYFKSIEGNLYNKNITTIYRYARNQKSFEIPNTVKQIGYRAFFNEDNLSQLILPPNLELIEAWNFQNTKIAKIDIPATVRRIDPLAFANSAITTVNISEENSNYKTEQDGAIILSKDGKVLVALLKNLATYNIPSSVETIDSYAFYAKTALKEIKLPEGIKSIKTSAFNYTIQLEKIEIPSTIQTIGPNAFFECYKLKEIIIDQKENAISGAPWACPFGLRAVIWKK